MRGSDPYKKERELEYAAHNRFAIRAMPACVAAYIFYVKLAAIEGGEFLESLKILILIGFFHLNIETIYKFLRNDNIYFTGAVFSLWCWCLYKLFWSQKYNIFEIFIPANVILIMLVRVIGYVDKYIKVKESI